MRTDNIVIMILKVLDKYLDIFLKLLKILLISYYHLVKKPEY